MDAKDTREPRLPFQQRHPSPSNQYRSDPHGGHAVSLSMSS